MNTAIGLLFSLAGWCAGEPSGPQYDSIPGLPAIDERFHRDYLEGCRQSRAVIEQSLEFVEKMLEEGPIRLTPESAAAARRELTNWREEIGKMKKWERELELWEQQRKLKPNFETNLAALERLDKLRKKLWPDRTLAPVPHEAKPPVP